MVVLAYQSALVLHLPENVISVVDLDSLDRTGEMSLLF
jgi:hypothetical protein